jgi:hypothetical protein
MKTHLLKTQQLGAEAFQWLQNKYLAADSMHEDRYGAFIADDCELHFANNPVAKGKAALLHGISLFWATIAGMNHNFQNVFGSDHYVILEALVDYTRKDTKVVHVPAVTIIERNAQGLCSNIRIFIDVSPVYA